MPMLESSVAITTSQHPSSAALPAKQFPEAIPTSGTSALRRAKRLKARQSRPATIGMSTSPGRPPPPSANSTTGSRRRSASSNRRSFFMMTAHALGAGQHRVVVGHHHAPPALDLTDPTHQAVGGSAGDQILARAPALLGGEEERPILDESTLVDEVREVLASGAPPALMALGDGLSARAIQPARVTLAHRLEVGALAVAFRSARLPPPCGSAAGDRSAAALESGSEGGAIARSWLIACRLCQPRRASSPQPSGVRP